MSGVSPVVIRAGDVDPAPPLNGRSRRIGSKPNHAEILAILRFCQETRQLGRLDGGIARIGGEARAGMPSFSRGTSERYCVFAKETVPVAPQPSLLVPTMARSLCKLRL
jgi:hypothetical protein